MPPPTSSTLSTSQLHHLVTLYPSTISSHYTSRVKDPTKHSSALSRDTWRYSLPSASPSSLTLPTLSSLVDWKITHGASRPFLPAMIRKNDPSDIEKHTTTAAKILSPLSPPSKSNSSLDETYPLIVRALDEVSHLKGVGPATASLILSIFKPDIVPFFEDELFAFLCKDEWKGKGGRLKYDRKEYRGLVERWWGVMVRLRREEEEGGKGEGEGEGKAKVGGREMEKAAFVLGHLELLSEEEREGVLAMGEEGDVGDEDKKDEVGASDDGRENEESKQVVKKGSKRALKPDKTKTKQDMDGNRRSKRLKT